MNSGIAALCGENNIGGVKRVLITDWSNATVTAPVAGVVPTITMASGTVFYEFFPSKNSSSLVEADASSIENGSRVVTQTLTLVFPKRKVATRNTLALMVQKDLLVIVQDLEDQYWLVGYKNGANITTVEANSGVAKADGQKYTVTIIGEEIELAPEVDDSIIAGLL